MGNMRVSRDAGTVAAAREAKRCSPLAKTAKKAGSSASRGEDAPKPERLSRVLATRLHNFPDREWFLPGRHFFMAPPGRVASPFFVHGARSSRALRLINEAAGGKIGLVLASVIGVTQANLIPALPCFRLTIIPRAGACS